MRNRANEQWLLACLETGQTRLAGGLPAPDQAEAEAIIQLALRHKVAPLLYRRLSAQAGSAPILGPLRQAYLSSAVRNAILYADLAEALQTLQNAGVPVIVLKGAHLGEVIYGNIALRPMMDIDLLVRREHLDQAGELLLGRGYRWARPFTFEPAVHHHRPPVVSPQGIQVELHWTIARSADRMRLDVGGLWQRSRPHTIAGIPTRVLSPEDLLVHLCVHVALQHLFRVRLQPLCDVAEAIHHYQGALDWEAVWQRADEWNVTRSVYLTLYAAHELLAAGVQAADLRQRRPAGFEAGLAAVAAELIFKDTADIPRNLVRLWQQPRLREKVAVVFRTLFPKTGHLANEYYVPRNSGRLYIYYVIHWKNLVRRYGRAVWQQARRDRQTIARLEREAKVHRRDEALHRWLTSA